MVPRCLSGACCFLLLVLLHAKRCCSPLDPKKVCKASIGYNQQCNKLSKLSFPHAHNKPHD